MNGFFLQRYAKKNMKTKIINIAILFITIAISTNAQIGDNIQSEIKYQGEVLTGYGIGIGNLQIDRTYIQTIHGLKFGDYFSAGIGIGMNITPAYDLNMTISVPHAPPTTINSSTSLISVPIFLNLKGYLPISKKLDLLLSMDVGHSIGVNGEIMSLNGLMINPAVGICFNNRLNFSFGYEHQKISTFIPFLTLNSGALSLKLGFLFP